MGVPEIMEADARQRTGLDGLHPGVGKTAGLDRFTFLPSIDEGIIILPDAKPRRVIRATSLILPSWLRPAGVLRWSGTALGNDRGAKGGRTEATAGALNGYLNMEVQ